MKSEELKFAMLRLTSRIGIAAGTLGLIPGDRHAGNHVRNVAQSQLLGGR